MFTGEDHLQTLLRVLEAHVLPTFAVYSLLRPAAEAAVLVAYLLDSAIDETQRLARSFNIEQSDLIEQDKFMPDDEHAHLRLQ